MHLAHYIPVRSGYCKYIFVGIFPLHVPISFSLQFYTFHIKGGKRFDIRKHQIHTHTHFTHTSFESWLYKTKTPFLGTTTLLHKHDYST